MPSALSLAVQPTLPEPTPANPWPGLAAYTESSQASFYGRDDEAGELLRRVSNARLTVLFGKSGLGKSSLLQAGLFPRLRRQNILPVYIRLRLQDDRLPLVDQLRAGLLEQLDALHIDAPPIESGEGVWEYLHRRDLELWSPTNHLLTPLFVLDQFEEVFTLGEQFHEAVAEFRGALGNLAENGIPRQVAARIESDPSVAERLDVRAWRYGMLVSLREDYLPHLEGWRRNIASLGGNRMRLLPMRRRQAYAAVHDAAPGLVSEKLAWRIVNHVSAASLLRTVDHTRSSPTESGSVTQSSILFDTGPTIEPALLSLFCAGLYERRRVESKDDGLLRPFDESLLEGAKEAIIADFYRDCIKGMPENVPVFIEYELITDRGYRNSYPVEDALKRGTLTQDQIDKLVDRRLLRMEQQYGTDRIELTHDVLTQAVREERDRRQAEADGAAYKLKAEEAQESLRQHQLAEERRRLEELEHNRRQRRSFIGMALVALLCLVLGAATWVQWRKAESTFRQALSFKLARKATNILEQHESGNLATSLLLGVASYRASADEDAEQALQRELEASRGISATMLSDKPLTSVAFSPDGKLIAAGSQDRTHNVLLWDSATHKPLGEPLDGHRDAVTNVVFSPDGKILASASLDKSVILWDVASRKALGTLTGHTDMIFTLAFSPDGATLATAGYDKSIMLWNVSSRVRIGNLGHGDIIAALAFSPDGKILAAAGRDKSITLWDMASRQPVGDPLLGHRDMIFSLAFSPDGKILASAGRDRSILLWDVASRAQIGRLDGHKDTIHSIVFSADGRLLASAGEDRSVMVWDVLARKPIDRVLDGHRNAVTGVAFSPDGKILASVGRDKAVILWDIATRVSLAEPFAAKLEGVMAMALSPDAKSLAIATRNGNVLICDVAGHDCGNPLVGHTDMVRAVAFSPDGRILASASLDKTVRLWDVEKRTPIGQPLARHADGVLAVSFSPDGRLLASASRDGTAILWDVATRSPLGAPMAGHKEAVLGVAFSPDGRMLATASRDNTVILWDVAGRSPLGAPLTGHKDSVQGIVFSPDGRTLASASRDNSVILWDIGTGKPKFDPLLGHSDAVRSVAFSPDGSLLASGGDDHKVMLWNIGARTHAGASLRSHRDKVASVVFSRDGRLLVSAGEESAMLWDLERLRLAGVISDLGGEDKLDRLCAKLVRNLSRAEWLAYAGNVDYIEQCRGLPMAE